MLGLCEFRLAACLSFAIAAAHGAIVIDTSKAAAPPQALPFPAGGKSLNGHTRPSTTAICCSMANRGSPLWRVSILALSRRALGRGNPQDEGRRHPHRLHLHFLDPPRGNRRSIRLVRPPRPPSFRSTGQQIWHVCLGASRTSGSRWGAQRRLTRLAHLEYVRRFYSEIGRQLAGHFWKDGGPIA